MLWCLAPAVGARGDSRLSVACEAPRLSVEAREVSLAAVRREIGAQVGFLAETTRRARQALGALIDGLATATRSLHESLSAGGK